MQVSSLCVFADDGSWLPVPVSVGGLLLSLKVDARRTEEILKYKLKFDDGQVVPMKKMVTLGSCTSREGLLMQSCDKGVSSVSPWLSLCCFESQQTVSRARLTDHECDNCADTGGHRRLLLLRLPLLQR